MVRRHTPRVQTVLGPEQIGVWRGEAVPSGRLVLAAVAGVVAAWIAAGSAGLLAHPLRHALVWLAGGLMLLAGWPQGRPGRRCGVLAAAILAAGILMVPATAVYNVLGVALLLAALAQVQDGTDRRALVITAYAVTVLGIFRFASQSVAAVWLAADRLGEGLGAVAALVSGKPLWVGATFGGVDFLVLMATLYGGWLWATMPRRGCALYGLGAILAAQLAYLILLAWWNDLAEALPAPKPPPEPRIYEPPPWFWSDAVAWLLPWNLPAIAVALHSLVAAGMFRWATWRPVAPASLWPATTELSDVPGPFRTALELGPVILAAAVPLVTAFSALDCDLSGRTILAFDQSHLNWSKPVHQRYGRAEAGLYGMLPMLIKSLGGQFSRSKDLAAEDLAKADVLVVIHPLGPWPEDRLQRVWDYVRGGGALLVAAEPRTWEDGQMSSFDELLRPTAIQVRFDTAIGRTDHWQHALHALAHPVTVGLGDQTGAFCLMESSSIRVRWPARPLLVGRWGWSDPGSDALLTGRCRLDPGERIGDLVLAAEQPIGKGHLIVLGDTTALTNEGYPRGYEFVGRMLGYLAGRRASTQAGWRQGLGLLGCLALVALLGCQLVPLRLASVSLVLGFSFGLATAIGLQRIEVLCDGRSGSPNNVACIDASHLEAYSGAAWLKSGLAGLKLTEIAEGDPRLPLLGRDCGIGGLELNLMRNGYLPIRLRRWSEAQLKRAGMLVSIAPARPFSASQKGMLKDFVQRGGIWVCMVGADRAGPINPVLAEFGLHVPLTGLPMGAKQLEPLPIGHKRTVFSDQKTYQCYALLDAGWPVEALNETVEGIAQGDGPTWVILAARVGKGTVILIGDSGFAWNRNLENDAGLAIDGVRENAAFWRWLIARFRDRQDWVPPEIPFPKTEPEQPANHEAVEAPHSPPKAGPGQDPSKEAGR
ncbi:MAG: DUF4350 domain-containing protein [Thermoguttaceae bacterium]